MKRPAVAIGLLAVVPLGCGMTPGSIAAMGAADTDPLSPAAVEGTGPQLDADLVAALRGRRTAVADAAPQQRIRSIANDLPTGKCFDQTYVRVDDEVRAGRSFPDDPSRHCCSQLPMTSPLHERS